MSQKHTQWIQSIGGSNLQANSIPLDEFLARLEKDKGISIPADDIADGRNDKDAPTFKQVGPYRVKYESDDPLFGTVASGPYAGERIGPCGTGSDSVVIDSIYLNPLEASKIRARAHVNSDAFYLDEGIDRSAMGRYCVRNSYKQQIAESLDCNDLEESCAPDYLESLSDLYRYVPLPGQTRCSKLKDVMAPSAFVEGTKVGAGFVGAGLAAEVLFKRTTGRSLFRSIWARITRKGAVEGAARVATQGARSAMTHGVAGATARKAPRVVMKFGERAARDAAEEAAELAAERAAREAARSATRVVAREAAEEGAEAGVKKGVQAVARKAPVPFWAKAAIFVTIEVGAALLLSDSAEASEAGRAKFGDHFESDREFERKKAMKDSCGESTGCYLANWALAPVGWVAESVSTPAY